MNNQIVTNQTTNDTSNTPTPEKESFWNKNKSWLKPVAIGVGGISLIAIGFAVLKPKHTSNKSSHQPSLSGVPKRKKNKGKHHRKKKASKPKYTKKKAVALL